MGTGHCGVVRRRVGALLLCAPGARARAAAGAGRAHAVFRLGAVHHGHTIGAGLSRMRAHAHDL